MIEVDFVPQGLSPSNHQLNGWNYWRGSLGSHICPRENGTSIRLTNGVYDGDGVGTAFIDHMDFTFDREVWIWDMKGVSKIAPNKIRVGTGQDIIAVGGTWCLDVFYSDQLQPEIQKTDQCSIGRLKIPLPQSVKQKNLLGQTYLQMLKTGVRPGNVNVGELWKDAFGFWMPYGIPISNDGGMKGIEPVYGWEQDWLTLVLMHRLNRQRSFIECRRAQNGEAVSSPILGPLGYNLERSNTINSKLPRFWKGISDDIFSDIRAVPRIWNDGTCPYFNLLHGGYEGFNDYNGQHLIRAYAKALAMWRMYGDLVALLDLQMSLADTYYAHPTTPKATKGCGSGWFGRREPAWVGYLRTEMGMENDIALQGAIAQMENGKIIRQPFSNTDGSIPSPYRWSDKVTDPLPESSHYSPSMEEWLFYHTLVSGGFLREAQFQFASEFLDLNSVTRTRGYCPKFLETGVDVPPNWLLRSIVANIRKKVTRGAGAPDYAPWLVLGTQLCMNLQFGRDPYEIIDAMMRIETPTMGKANSRADLIQKLTNEWTGRHQVIAALSGLERS